MKIFDDLKAIINTPDDDSLYSYTIKPKVSKINVNIDYDINVFKPLKFEEATDIAKSIISGNIVIINLSSTSHDVARRIIDFLSGSTFERNIQINRLSNMSFLFAPINILIDDRFICKLKDTNIEF